MWFLDLLQLEFPRYNMCSVFLTQNNLGLHMGPKLYLLCNSSYIVVTHCYVLFNVCTHMYICCARAKHVFAAQSTRSTRIHMILHMYTRVQTNTDVFKPVKTTKMDFAHGCTYVTMVQIGNIEFQRRGLPLITVLAIWQLFQYVCVGVVQMDIWILAWFVQTKMVFA